MASIINAATSGGLISTADTSGVLQLQTAGTTAVTVDASQNVTFANSASLPNTFGFKNRIINGDMRIDQRNVGASVTPTNGQYTLDRWVGYGSVVSKYSIQQNAGSVTPPAGFTNYLGVTSLSAYSITAGDYFLFRQMIEGFNSADLAWGTASAKSVTLSFYVYSSLTGTFGGGLGNSTNGRTYPFSYSIPTANTWTQISVTIAGDTSGTWVTNNGIGIQVGFGLGVGSTYSGTAGAWSSSAYLSATGAVSVVGTSGATLYITGVQLEKGSTATSFDVRDFGRELIMCQRYFEKSYDITTAIATSTADGLTYAGVGSGLVPNNYGFMTLVFTITKRSSPTMKIYSRSGTLNQVSNGDQNDYGTVNAQNIGMRSAIVVNGTGSNLSPSAGMTCAHFTADSEL